MIELFEIIFISIAQGIGEFLPISSSGHNAIAVHLFERFGVPLTENSAEFIKLNVVLHVGTLVAVLIVFRRRILDLFGKDLRLIPLLIVGTIPAVVIGLTVKKTADWVMEDLTITSFCFLVTGGLLLVSPRFSQGEKTCSKMTYLDALFIGLVQAFAILPGISRSGSTIVAGLFRNLRRDEAATYSFLLSIPVIAGGGVLELKDLLKEGGVSSNGSLSPMLLLVGLVLSCLIGIFALIWLMNWLQKGKLWYFAVWVFLMCPVTLTLALIPLPEKPNAPVEPVAVVSTDHPTRETIPEVVPGIEDSSEPADRRIETTPETDKEKQSRTPDAEESPETTSRLNMTREEALREYEKILAEEEARELALIEEEQTRSPVVDDPDKLIRLPLDAKDRIWITPDGKSVVLLGRVALREGLLELFACRIGTKEHESVVSVRLKPYLIHAALLAVGAEPGRPVQFTPRFVPPSGDEIEILIRWIDAQGRRREVRAQEWVLDQAASTETKKKEMTTPWVFTGSMIYKDSSGANHYVADESGELFGLSNFVGAILDIPIESSADNNQLLFTCFTERIPETGTPLTLILTPVKNKNR